VIEINERFVAVVVCPAKYINVLNIVTPSSAVTQRYRMFPFRISNSDKSGFNAKGKKTITATTHLQNARLIGGILSFRPRAIIKLPDQRAVATMAKR
jgi:hypothetical protein